MAKVFISPNKYVQGRDEIKNIGEYSKAYGKKALILISGSGKKRVGEVVEQSFEKAQVKFDFVIFNGECSKNEINRLIKFMEDNGCDMVLGIGGGKILDTSKAVSYYTHSPVIICPTIASSDAPCSALSVIYTDEGVYESYLFLPANPNLVIMDTNVIAKSPVRLTLSGVGDALATYFEARACYASGAISCAGGKSTQAALSIAKLCYDTLKEEGLKAKIALELGVCTEAVEKIIEANTLLSGIGFESCGIAAAHAIHNGFTVLPETHEKFHGEKVAFGTLAQLVLEDIPENELRDIYNFCIDMGLPVTLEQIGITQITDEKLMAVAETACSKNDTMHNLPFEVNKDTVVAAIKAANALGERYLKQ